MLLVRFLVSALLLAMLSGLCGRGWTLMLRNKLTPSRWISAAFSSVIGVIFVMLAVLQNPGGISLSTITGVLPFGLTVTVLSAPMGWFMLSKQDLAN